MCIGTKIIRLDQIESTNSYLKSIAAQVPSGTVVVAAEQTLGRGRNEKQWFSQRGKSLTFSILLSQRAGDQLYAFFNLFPAVALVRSLRSQGIQAQIKWPNDILLEGRKIGGILVEALSKPEKADIIIGIGLNVLEESSDFPESIRSAAGSIWSITKKRNTLESVFQNILTTLNATLTMAHDPQGMAKIREMWSDYCLHLNRPIRIHQKKACQFGYFIGLDENGFAILQHKDEKIIIRDYLNVSLREENDTCN